jgi:hypothetical protein
MFHKMTLKVQIVLFLLTSLFYSPAAPAQGLNHYPCDINGESKFRQAACEPRLDLSHACSPDCMNAYGLVSTSEQADVVSRAKPRRSSERQCWKKRQSLQRVQRKLRTGYRASEYQRLHDRRRSYEDYLRRFCRS